MMGNKIFICLLAVMMFIGSGCVTLSKSKAKKTDPVGMKPAKVKSSTQPQPVLTEKEKYDLKNWMHAAELGESVGDIETAISFYTKVKDVFSDTKEGQVAESKLKELKKSSAKNP